MSGRLQRLERVRGAMAGAGVEAMLLSLGADLPWLTGYRAMPLERLTMLVLPSDAPATLVIPRLEAPRVEANDEFFEILPWDEGADPVSIVAGLVGRRTRLAVSDRAWAVFLLALQQALPAATWSSASSLTAPLRAVKDGEEIEALAAASAAADRVAADLLTGRIPLIGRSEREVSEDIGRRLIAEGHEAVNFAIVGSGPNSASPHHDPGPRVISPGEAVVCDFGGTMNGYCSDITRTVFTGSAPGEFADLHQLLAEAQAAAVSAAGVGATAEEVDAVPRGIIASAGYGAFFIHRTGHGIGLEEHEDPYIAAGNATALVAGNAFSIEPGIYIPGRWGARIEDIVVATERGPRPLNHVEHKLVSVEA